MAGSTPVWLIDVDDVLNADRPPWSEAPHKRMVVVDGLEYRVRWSPSLMRRVRVLLNTGLVEGRWATSWVGHTRRLEQLWALPELADAFTVDPADNITAIDGKKLAAALDVLAAGRPLIWTDDRSIPAGAARQQLQRPDVLLIEPIANRGLSRDHMARIEEFVAMQRTLPAS